MKKINIITLHRVPNYGSVLQTYATQKIFERFNLDAYVIDYCPKRFNKKYRIEDEYSRLGFRHKNFWIKLAFYIIIYPSIITQHRVFSNFLKNKVKLTREYNSEEELKDNPPDSDIFCTGSDQVWNSNTNGFIERPFYLSFIKENKIAFSSSFGRANIENDELEEIKPLLSEYLGIGVREKSGEKILKQMNISNYSNTLDPTLVLKKEEWDTLANVKNKKKYKYVLVYTFNDSLEIDKIATEVAKRKKAKVIHISYWYHKRYSNHKLAILPEVEEFVSLIKNAECVITNSFHAVAFSTIFNKDFIAVYPKNFSVRLKDYLELIKLESQHIENVKEVSDKLFNIDYQETNKILDKQRKKTLEYLEGLIKLTE